MGRFLRRDRRQDQPQQISVSSLWVGAILTIILSVLSGWLVSRLVYAGLPKKRFKFEDSPKKPTKKPGFYQPLSKETKT